MLKPTKWHPQDGEEFWSAKIEVSSSGVTSQAVRHIFNKNNGEVLTLVGFDNCYRSKKEACRQANRLAWKLLKKDFI